MFSVDGGSNDDSDATEALKVNIGMRLNLHFGKAIVEAVRRTWRDVKLKI